MKELSLTAAILMLASPAFAVDGKDVFGIWKVQSGSALIEIKDCGDGTPCGSLVHINSPDAASVLDDQNPDPKLAKKPLLGSRMLWGFEAKKHKWSGGRKPRRHRFFHILFPVSKLAMCSRQAQREAETGQFNAATIPQGLKPVVSPE